MEAASVIKHGARYRVGNGKSIRVWESPWIHHNLSPRCLSPKPAGCHITWVSELLLPGVPRWNAALIHQLFNPQEAELILNMPLSQLGLQDRLLWNHTNQGNFNVDSAYSWLSNQRPSTLRQPETSRNKAAEKCMWKRLWSMKIQGKLKHFLWRAYHYILPTQDNLAKKGITVEPMCSTCGEAAETLEHLFFSCPQAMLTWKLAPVSWEGLSEYTHDFQHWWKALCTIGTDETHQDRLELTAHILWNLWKARNDWIFNSKRLPPMEISQRAQLHWLDFKAATMPLANLPKPGRVPPCAANHHTLMTETVGFYFLETSSILQKHPRKAAFGVCATTPDGSPQLAKAIICEPGGSATQIALEAIRSAQLAAYNAGWKRIHIRTDIEEIVPLINRNQAWPGSLGTLFDDISLLQTLFDNCVVSFSPRNTRNISFRLAQHALASPISENWGPTLPACLDLS